MPDARFRFVVIIIRHFHFFHFCLQIMCREMSCGFSFKNLSKPRVRKRRTYSSNQFQVRTRGEGVNKSKNFGDVTNGSSLTFGGQHRAMVRLDMQTWLILGFDGGNSGDTCLSGTGFRLLLAPLGAIRLGRPITEHGNTENQPPMGRRMDNPLVLGIRSAQNQYCHAMVHYVGFNLLNCSMSILKMT